MKTSSLDKIKAAAIGLPVDIEEGSRADTCFIVNAHGGAMTLFCGNGVRGYAAGRARDFPTVTGGRYGGHGWQKRLVLDAWRALEEVWKDEPPPAARPARNNG